MKRYRLNDEDAVGSVPLWELLDWRVIGVVLGCLAVNALVIWLVVS